jgi:hypothetical protein
MKRTEVEHILRAAKAIAGEDEFILLGSQSVLGAFPDAPLALRRSIELDIYPKHHPEKSELIDGAIGNALCFTKPMDITRTAFLQKPHTCLPDGRTDWFASAVKTPAVPLVGVWMCMTWRLANSLLAGQRTLNLS